MAHNDIISRKIVGYLVTIRQIEDREVVEQTYQVTEGTNDNPTKRGYVDRVVRQAAAQGPTLLEMVVPPATFNWQAVVAVVSGLPVPPSKKIEPDAPPA